MKILNNLTCDRPSGSFFIDQRELSEGKGLLITYENNQVVVKGISADDPALADVVHEDMVTKDLSE